MWQHESIQSNNSIFQAMNKNIVCVALVNWNGFDDSVEAIESFLNVQKPGEVLLLVDNGSTDGSVSKLRKHFRNKIEYLALDLNTGMTGGTNAAFEWSSQNAFKYTIVGNNDIIFDEDSVSALVDRAEINDRIGAVGPKMYLGRDDKFYYTTGSPKYWGVFYGMRGVGFPSAIFKYGKSEEMAWFAGTFVLYRNKMIQEIGGLDENFFISYEDIEFGYRIRAFGWKIWYEPKSIIWHKVARTRGLVSL